MISIISESQDLTPGYNPVYYYFDSDNKTELGFKYIVDVYVKEVGGFVKVKTAKISPEPVNGYGIVEISKLLQSYLNEGDVSLIGGDNTVNNGISIEYKLQIGESFQYSWEFDSIQKTSTLGFAGKVQLNGSTTHTFVDGDIVKVQQTTGTTQPLLSNTHTVIYTLTNDFAISLDYTSITSDAITGKASYANNNTIDTHNLLEVDDKVAFNGADTFLHFPSWNEDDFITDTGLTKPFLTNQPVNFKVLPDANCVLNYAIIYGGTTTMVLLVENSLGTKKYVTINNPASSTTTVGIGQVGVGPANINESWTTLTGSGDIITETASYYDVWISNTTSGAGSEFIQKYRYYLDWDCSEFDSYSISFLDRLGSISSFPFRYKSNIKNKIKRTDQAFLLNSDSESAYTYDGTASGYRTTNISSEQSLTLNTAWLSQVDSDYFQELVSSPVTFMKINGVLQSVVITTNSSEQKKLKNDTNIKYKINIKLSNNDNINY